MNNTEINNIITNSLNTFITDINKILCTDQLLLKERYVFNPKEICIICDKNVFNKERYCKKHLKEQYDNEDIDFNIDINNNKLIMIGTNVYEDVFGIKFKLDNNKLIKIDS